MITRNIFFHSYKGGVGRTYLLANVAIELINSNYKVGIVDLDYDAPGVSHMLYKHFNNAKLETVDKDLVYLLVDDEPMKTNEAVKKFSNDKLLLLSINPHQPANRMDRLYDLTLKGGFNKRLFKIINVFIDLYKLDFVLFDLRPGFSFLVYTMANLSDLSFQIFRVTTQDLYGTKILSNALAAKSDNANVLIPSLIPMSIENYEVKLEEILNREFGNKKVKPIHGQFIPLLQTLLIDDSMLVDNLTIDKGSVEFAKIMETIKSVTERIKGLNDV
ncbi:Cobyrinic acid a,c-diamide synthase domain protein [Candidatus Magnetobacterium bavaricum]|uniref:Cobyrinic acid a,c-diamide synthase domain protein n=1 Tax=Candidatus Magnetobacterium bavaricum TaxID=29290 RepID=A0A0F3GVD8_9BACT|nr:Cobyrinic acid a,c-diamide synthase domain protein [Candidatus Magnetobacterium bavaricum]KJU85865.1 Cobyrinic acid a,c-diamide synthase domain protein [Candidatus Magnetobacterium bavaricum]